MAPRELAGPLRFPRRPGPASSPVTSVQAAFLVREEFHQDCPPGGGKGQRLKGRLPLGAAQTWGVAEQPRLGPLTWGVLTPHLGPLAWGTAVFTARSGARPGAVCEGRLLRRGSSSVPVCLEEEPSSGTVSL